MNPWTLLDILCGWVLVILLSAVLLIIVVAVIVALIAATTYTTGLVRRSRNPELASQPDHVPVLSGRPDGVVAPNQR